MLSWRASIDETMIKTTCKIWKQKAKKTTFEKMRRVNSVKLPSLQTPGIWPLLKNIEDHTIKRMSDLLGAFRKDNNKLLFKKPSI